MSAAQNALILIVQTFLGFYFLIAALRFVLQLSQANFYNPISMMVARLTQPPLKVLRYIFPKAFGLDLATIALLVLVCSIENLLLFFLQTGQLYLGLSIALSLSQSLNVVIWIFLLAIFASAILSWFTTSSSHPIIATINDISNNALLPIRKLIPGFSGIDLSPIFAILALRLLQILIVAPLETWAFSLVS